MSNLGTALTIFLKNCFPILNLDNQCSLALDLLSILTTMIVQYCWCCKEIQIDYEV